MGTRSEDYSARIESLRQSLGEKLLILAHHYTVDEVYDHADFKGDSFQLSAAAAENKTCDHIVFCGVHFMAETADVLANAPEKLALRNGRRVDVVIPDPKAGCSMADMANIGQIETCWAELGKVLDTSKIVPVTYVNSSAALKAFCGRNGGIACTSSNAAAVLKWALSRNGGSKVLFFPDQHLGRNTALKLGIPEKSISLWIREPQQPFGGNDPEKLKESSVVLWDGYCGIHQVFKPQHVQDARERYPGIRVIVHPECDHGVVEQADEAGSTRFILDRIDSASPGDQWAVGTEWQMVKRLAAKHPEQRIVNLSPEPSVCETMFMNTAANLLAALEGISQGNPRNIVRVPESNAEPARICLERMLQVQ